MVMWPKDFKFCGVCSLKVGVIFYIIIHLMSNGLSLFFLWTTITSTRFEDAIATRNSTEIDNEEFNGRMGLVLWSFIAVFVFFIAMEGLFIGLLIYGLRKFTPLIVKIHLIYGLIMWIFAIMTGVATGLVLQITKSVIRIIMSLFHGFMLLNLRKLYMIMTKKSQAVVILSSDITSTAVVGVNCTEESSHGSTYIAQHCRTCSCNQRPTLTNQISRDERLSTNASISTDSLSTSNRDFNSQADQERISNVSSKQLNFKEDAIIYDEEQLERSRMNAACAHAQEHENESYTKEKNNIFNEKDVPVIYDENQFNVGRNHILKEKSLTQDLAVQYVQENEQLKRNQSNAADIYFPKYEKQQTEIKEKNEIFEEKNQIFEDKSVPVIYDENQFNIGKNYISEDKPVVQNVVNYPVQITQISLPSSSVNITKKVI